MREIMNAAEVAAHYVGSRERDYRYSDDGYSDMELETKRGWRVVPCWGSHGWDLGDWPYVAFFFCENGGSFRVLEIVEGDRSEWAFNSAEDRSAAVDFMFTQGHSWEYVQRDIAAGDITAEGWRGAYVRVPR